MQDSSKSAPGAWSPLFAPVALVLLVVWEFAVLTMKAGRTPLWYDELLTFHVSSLPSFALVRQALQAGVDGMPAGYYLLIRLTRALPVDPQVACRLLSIIGYVLTLLGAWWFVTKRLPAAAGLAAVLLIALSPFRGMALEARSYAILVGFLAMAAVCWQRIDAKRWMIVPFTLFLTLAVSCHHLAVVTLSCFGLAEVTGSIQARRIRWAVWAAFAVASVPFLAGVPTLLHFREIFGRHFWSPSKWNLVLSTYADYVGIEATRALVPVFVIGIAAGAVLLRVLSGREEAAEEQQFPAPEVLLIGGFLLYPAVLVVLTKLLGSGYTPRYGWPAILGLVPGAIYVLRTIWHRSSTAALLCALVIAFAIQNGLDLTKLAKAAPPLNERWGKLAEAAQSEPALPVVIGSGMTYLEAAKYATGDLRERLIKVTDPAASVRLVNTDTIDQANLRLAEFTLLRLQTPAAFEASYPRFLLYSGGNQDWLTAYLMEKSYHFRLLSPDGEFAVYLVER